jgi:hypothetical protein
MADEEWRENEKISKKFLNIVTIIKEDKFI